MKPVRKIPVLFAASLLAAASLSAADNPYRAISEKNAFRLVPPPVIKPPEPVKLEAPTNIKFMGMSGVGSEITAWFAIDKKDPKNPSPVYVSLSPGQRNSVDGNGGLELVQLNDTDGSAKIRYNNEERYVSMEKAPKAGGPVPGQPMIPTFTGAPFNPAVPYPAPASSALANPVGGQSMRSALGGGGSIPAPQLPVNVLQGIPTRSIRSGALANPTPEATATPMTYEQSIVHMEVLRELTRKDVSAGKLPPLPPTPISPGQQAPPVPGGGN